MSPLRTAAVPFPCMVYPAQADAYYVRPLCQEQQQSFRRVCTSVLEQRMGPKRRMPQQQGYDQDPALEASAEDPMLGAVQLATNPLAPITVPASPFSFDRRRLKIDWRLLHGVDVDRVVRETDLDLLEKVVSMAVYGDLEAEDPAALSPLNFGRICRVAQLTGEYLLHVQDRLALENSQLKDERLKTGKYVEALRLRIREQREGSRDNRRELRRAQRSLRAYEALAAAAKAEAESSSLGAAKAEELRQKLTGMQGQVVELKGQREALLMEIKHLKDDMQAASAQGRAELEAAVKDAGRREQQLLEQRLAQLQEQLDQERQLNGQQLRASRDRDEEVLGLREQLASLRVQQRSLQADRDSLQAELNTSKRSQMVSSSEQDATLQLAEARAKRLAQSLQESEAEVSSLKSRLQASERALAAAQMDASLQQEKGASDLQIENARLLSEMQNLENELQSVERERDRSSSSVSRLTEEVAQLRSRLEAAEVGQAQNGSSAGSEQQQILALKSTIADLEKALKDAETAKAEAEQDADMIERQLQQARADSSVSKAELPAPPETPPAPRRTLSGKRQPSSNLQGFLTRTTSDVEASDARVQTQPAYQGLPTVQEQGESAQQRDDDEVSDFGQDQEQPAPELPPPTSSQTPR
ncbi:hypothetical protein WJX84_001448, partial [Apatococcus fuscideae]